MEKLKDALQYLRHFGNVVFGMYQEKFDAGWDDRLNRMLDDNVLIEFSEHTITLRDLKSETSVVVWCSNEYYSFGWDYTLGKCEGSYRPRFKTMLRLKKYVRACHAGKVETLSESLGNL